EPWPNAETTVPSGSFTVRPVDFSSVAAQTAGTATGAPIVLSVRQSVLNSRRFSIFRHRSLIVLVRTEGLEPSRENLPRDFKSLPSTIPPRPRGIPLTAPARGD